jgi:hypothetical protein
VDSIDASCAASALSFMGNALAATHNVSDSDLSSVVTKVEQGLMSILRETAARLIAGQASVASSNTSATAITRSSYGSRDWAAAALATEDTLFSAAVSYSLPSVFEDEAGLDFLKDVDVLFGAFVSVPSFGGVAPVGPLVTLLVSQNGVNVPVAGLSESITISIPFSASHRAVGGKGKCVYINGPQP